VQNVNLEPLFKKACADAPLHKNPDVWPSVAERIACRSRAVRPRRLAFAGGLAAVLAALLLFAPVRSAAQKFVKKLISATYHFSLYGRRYPESVMVMMDGETKALNSAGGRLEIKLESLSADAAKVSLRLYAKDGKLVASPVVVTRKNTVARVVIGEAPSALLDISITPKSETLLEYEVSAVPSAKR